MKHNIDLEKLDFSKTISEISRELNVPFTTLKRILKKNNLFSKFKVSLRDKNVDRYNLNPKKCKKCGGDIPYDKKENYYCSSSCFGFDQPKRACSQEQKDILSKLMKEKLQRGELYIPRFNKQSQKETLFCKTCNTSFQVLPSSNKRKYCSITCSSKAAGRGGYRPTAGTVYSGWYKGYFCNSSWELAWVIYSLDHDVKFKRNDESFEYIFNNKVKKYYPDFKLEDSNEYVEIKGFKSDEWNEKLKAFPHKLSILYKKEMTPVLNYVKFKYGKDFIKMYESVNKVKQF